ncbi:MAG: hypothetical protein HQM03_17475 [Magnetococcales bacterium]|nr:hypothetical protein [Magnetococcales bacterium]
MIGSEPIGFSQRIQLAWLEYTARLVLAGLDRRELTLSLQEYLQEKLSAGRQSERGNRAKAISILLNIWLVGKPAVPALRSEGLELLRTLPERHHLPVHWGMSMAVYPFFGVVAEHLGRLLRLQESVSTAQVLRRLTERYGERETVLRAARRILRLFVDWGVLLDAGTPGVYRRAENPGTLPEGDLASWLTLARFAANHSRMDSLRSLAQHPSLFPFSMETPSPGSFEKRPGIMVLRQGFEHDIFLTLEL